VSCSCYTAPVECYRGPGINMKRSDIVLNQLPLVVLTGLLLSAACSSSQEDPGDASASGHAADAAVEATAPTAETADTLVNVADQPLPSLDDLLPETLKALTAEWTGDFDGMAERHVLRTLVIAGGPQFFYYQGKPRGIVTELLGLFQQELNVGLGRKLRQVEIVPMPVSREQLIPALVSGHADLIAADLTITDARAELVDFSDPLVTNINEIVVFEPGAGKEINTLEELAGRAIYVRRSSSYFEHLSELNADFARRGIEPIEILEANELLRPQDILEMVNAGLVSATVIDSYKADYWSEILQDMDVRNDLVVNEGGVIAWVFRKNSPQLAAVVNSFVHGHRQGTLVGNVLIKRYMEHLDWIRNSTSASSAERLRSLYEIFSDIGRQNNLDPLMLAAQAYQESELDQSRESPVGAIGIMQVRPETANDRNVGVADISTAEGNILAGGRYMRFLMDRYFSDPGMDELQSWTFALAAYNAGPAKIQRLRNEAAAEGHDPNLWLDNVELIAARKIGRETVRYVRNVFKYYVAYKLYFDARERRQAIEISDLD